MQDSVRMRREVATRASYRSGGLSWLAEGLHQGTALVVLTGGQRRRIVLTGGQRRRIVLTGGQRRRIVLTGGQRRRTMISVLAEAVTSKPH